MKVNCEIIEDLLPLYHDGVCSDTSRKLVDNHLESCADLKVELKDPSEIFKINLNEISSCEKLKKIIIDFFISLQKPRKKLFNRYRELYILFVYEPRVFRG